MATAATPPPDAPPASPADSDTLLRLGDDLDGAPLLPGFRLPLATLFENAAD